MRRPSRNPPHPGARGPFSFRLPPGWRNAGAVDILEEPSEAKTAHGLTPFEIRSWRLAPG